MTRIALIVPALLLAAAPLSAQTQLPPAQNLDMLEAMVVNSLGAGIGMAGGPMAPIDRRMRLAACPTGLQIDPPTAGAVTVRCTTSGWRLRVPLTRSFNPVAATAVMGGQTGTIANADVRKGDPIQLVAQGSSFSISVDATAMEDGRIGNRIRVAPSAKGQPIFAEVVDVGRVRLLGFK